MYTNANWKKFISAMNAGQRCQISEEIYEYFFGVFPPRWMGKTVKVGGEKIDCNFGTGEGNDVTTAFWAKGDQYFCQKIDQADPNDLVVGGLYRYTGDVFRHADLRYVGTEPGYWGTQYYFEIVDGFSRLGGGYKLSARSLNDLDPIKESTANA